MKGSHSPWSDRLLAAGPMSRQRTDHVFKATGTYHIRFASDAGGFNYADVPLLHVHATATTADVDQKTPFPTLGAVVVVLAPALARSIRKR